MLEASNVKPLHVSAMTSTAEPNSEVLFHPSRKLEDGRARSVSGCERAEKVLAREN